MSGKPVSKTRYHLWPPPKVRLARYLLPLINIGLAVHLLLPQIASLKDSIHVIRSMAWWLVGLAIIAQICSYLAAAISLKRLLILENPGCLLSVASQSRWLPEALDWLPEVGSVPPRQLIDGSRSAKTHRKRQL